MAAETALQEPLLQFIREITARESANLPGLNSEWVEGEPPPRVFVSGWGKITGVLIYRGPVPGHDNWRAIVAASDERALRDLLLGFPGRGNGVLFFCGRWMLPAVQDLFDGKELPDQAGYFYGARRGAPGAFGRQADGANGDGRTASPRLASKETPVLQRLRALKEPAVRRAETSFVAEGPALVQRAIRDGQPVESVLCLNSFAATPDGREIANVCARAEIACYSCSDGLMGTITSSRPLPAVLASVHFTLYSADVFQPTAASALLVAENLQNPDNLGMLLRTADGAGVDAVVITDAGVDPLHKNCVRAARGAVGRIPLYTCADLPGWLGNLRERGFTTLGATAHGDADLYAQPMEPPLAFVVGNEETGLLPQTLAACTSRVRIPMASGQSSLNVAVAAGVLLFEFVRRSDRR